MKGSGRGCKLIVDCLLVGWPRYVRHDPAHFLWLVNRDFSAADAGVMTYVPAWEAAFLVAAIDGGPRPWLARSLLAGLIRAAGAQPRMAATSSTGPAPRPGPGQAGRVPRWHPAGSRRPVRWP